MGEWPLAAAAKSEDERGARPRAVGPEQRGCPPAATAGTAGIALRGHGLARTGGVSGWDGGVSGWDGAGPEAGKGRMLKS